MTTLSETTTDARHAAAEDVLFIGNATVLIRYGGLTILTDPNFVPAGEDVAIGYGMTTRRVLDPAMSFEELPAIDAVVLSHFHGDHFDRIAEERLGRSIPIITTPGAADQLAERGFRATAPLETWESTELVGSLTTCTITAMPGQHATGPAEFVLPEVMGSILEFRNGEAADPLLRVYLSGDTVMYEGLRSIAEREATVDLAFLHLGGTRVMGLTVTMDADQGVELLETIRPRLAVPIHTDDYEAFKSPLSDFRRAVEAAGLSDHVRYLERGDRLAL
jgi:L-ascorbate metabolism protein UlaG (beta-lactamase superfamily)